MGVTKKMQMLYAEFEAAIEDRDAESVLNSAPEMLAELRRFQDYYYKQVTAETKRPTLTDAEREITHWRLEAEVHRKRAAAAVAEIERLRLTDAEREAIDFAWCSVGRDDAFNEQHADSIRETLEQLLERTK